MHTLNGTAVAVGRTIIAIAENHGGEVPDVLKRFGAPPKLVQTMLNFLKSKTDMPAPEEALPGRDAEMPGVPETHFVLGTPLKPPFPEGIETAMFGMGCFWGAEKGFWELDGVYTTAVGYAGGHTPNPTYEEVCCGPHRPQRGRVRGLRPGQGLLRGPAARLLGGPRPDPGDAPGQRRGHPVPLRRSTSTPTTQRKAAEASREGYQEALGAAGYGEITTEIVDAPPLYYAEDYHQQYLAKVPNGYCGLGGTGVSCPVGLVK